MAKNPKNQNTNTNQLNKEYTSNVYKNKQQQNISNHVYNNNKLNNKKTVYRTSARLMTTTKSKKCEDEPKKMFTDNRKNNCSQDSDLECSRNMRSVETISNNNNYNDNQMSKDDRGEESEYESDGNDDNESSKKYDSDVNSNDNDNTENFGASINLLAEDSTNIQICPINASLKHSQTNECANLPVRVTNDALIHSEEASEIVIENNIQDHYCCKKYPTLTKCEINQLTSYTRKTFFRRCKFVNAGVLHSHMPKFFQQMMVSDPNSRLTKTVHVIKCVKDTLSSRRGYATTQICNRLRGKLFYSRENDIIHILIYILSITEKMLAGTIFEMKIIRAFRKDEDSEECEDGVDYPQKHEVEEAWYSFLKDFCTLASYEWHEYLNNVVNIEYASFLGTLTTSDEAFTMWTILCKYEEAVKDTEEIKKEGKEAWLKGRKKRKRGPHDSREYMDLYSQLYQSIFVHRRNKQRDTVWQKLFFEKYVNENKKGYSEREVQYDDHIESSYLFKMPNLDGELDGFDDLPIPIFEL